MNIDIILIIRSCSTLHDVENELNTPLSFFKFKDKKECKKLKEMIHQKINSLVDDVWTIPYLFDLQQTLKFYSSKLDSYMMNKIYISEDEENDPTKFSSMYFTDIDRDNKIIIDILSDTITFTIFDNHTGNSFSVSSKDKVQGSQKKIESVCKERLMEVLSEYCDCIGGTREV